MDFSCHRASLTELETIWDHNIRTHPQDSNWVLWKEQFITYNRTGMARTYVITCQGHPIGEATLLICPDCAAIRGRLDLADGVRTANINALRIEKAYEGHGYVSRMIRQIEQEAADAGFTRITIGVEAKQTRNLGIYLHWAMTGSSAPKQKTQNWSSTTAKISGINTPDTADPVSAAVTHRGIISRFPL